MAVALGMLICAYLVSRADMLRAFSSQGALFVVRTSGLSFLLDVLRSACFTAAFGLRLKSRVAGAGRARISVVPPARLAMGGAAQDKESLQDRLSI